MFFLSLSQEYPTFCYFSVSVYLLLYPLVPVVPPCSGRSSERKQAMGSAQLENKKLYLFIRMMRIFIIISKWDFLSSKFLLKKKNLNLFLAILIKKESIC